jgi:tetratricopeptide (TPR) repeat protein
MSSSRRPGPLSALADPAAFSRGLDEAAAHFNAGRLDAAAQVYRRLEREAPDDVRAAYSLAVIDIRQDRLPRARSRLEGVVARHAGLTAAWHNLGAVCQRLGDWPAAAEAYGRAVALDPDAGPPRAGLAAALATLGRGDEAIVHHRALAQNPAHRWAALIRIVLIDPSAVSDEDLAAMLAARNVAGDAEIGLRFALGDVLEQRGRQAEAFEDYAAGNRLKRVTADAEAVANANARAAHYVQEMISPRFLAAHAGQGSRSSAPIFVIGMPRSGSTLIEQILASHPEVQGLGETGVLPPLVTHGYPQTAKGLRELAEAYLAAMRTRGWDGTSRFVDKTLENYLHAGLIGLLFPNATILHAARDPVDTGFACYRQLFTSGNETLYDLADIGAEYVRYRGLMDRWSAILPGRITDVRYEALVAAPDVEIPRLVMESAGLAWDPATLRFHERAGPVRTASASQVRRPIYTSSVKRWRAHAERLQPLIDALGPYGKI